MVMYSVTDYLTLGSTQIDERAAPHGRVYHWVLPTLKNPDIKPPPTLYIQPRVLVIASLRLDGGAVISESRFLLHLSNLVV